MQMRKDSFAPAGLLGTSLMLLCSASHAKPLIESEELNLLFDAEIVAGYFTSSETYGNPDDSPDWTEGYAKFGFSGDKAITAGTLFGTANLLYSATGGDGDAAGLTTGDESELDVEELFVGFRNDMFSISIGRQNVSFGDGFIIQGDALNLGEGLDGIVDGFSADRGGAYWLAARKVFSNTVLISAGGETGPRGDLFYLDSDNPGQASTELAGVNLEYTLDAGTFGLLYVNGLAVDDDEAEFLGLQRRDGQNTFSVRYQGNAGVENLFLSGEYANQTQGNDDPDADAYYLEAGWTFANAPWTPSVNARVTEYDTGYDPLFFGFSRGFGTWFQGEVAANYAGPFGTDSTITTLMATASPMETLTVGASYFRFTDTAVGSGDNDATEVNVWAEYAALPNLIIYPLLGLYTPDSDTSTQGNDDTNAYSQVFAVVPF